MTNFHDIPVTLTDDTHTTLADWAGHVLLIATPASTSKHSDTLAELFHDYAARGFFAIGAGTTTDTSFPLLKEAPELWDFLGVGELFVVAPDGDVLGRFGADTEPDDLVITDLIEEHLPI